MSIKLIYRAIGSFLLLSYLGYAVPTGIDIYKTTRPVVEEIIVDVKSMIPERRHF